MNIIRNRVPLFLFVGFQLCVGTASAQISVTITEPAQVKIEDLFKQADVVAVMRTVSGDLEHYPVAVYKAEVLKSFKGSAVGTKIFFGPYGGYSLGGEYLVFLRRSEKHIEPSNKSKNSVSTYGPLPSFYEVMYEGYSAMPVKYACVFDGQDPAHQCDDGIKVNTYQVILPIQIRTFPPESDDVPNGDYKWIRKAAFISFLRTLAQ